MRHFYETFLLPVTYVVLVYFVALGLFYLIMYGSAALEMRRYLREVRAERYHEILSSEVAPSISMLVPAHNEEQSIRQNVQALLTVAYPQLEIVVVDNGSRDGSAQLLAEAERGGVCTLLANHRNRHHGPGLNQGISYLASRPGPRPAWIWILDSDVVAARPGALSAAVTVARAHSAALVGEPQHDQWHPDGRFGQYSLLMDPAVAWQQQPGPFTGGGDPSHGLLTSAVRLGIPMAPFPFTAAGHHEPHFAGVPGAAQRYHALQQEFRQQTGPLTGATLAAACQHAPGHE